MALKASGSAEATFQDALSYLVQIISIASALALKYHGKVSWPLLAESAASEKTRED